MSASVAAASSNPTLPLPVYARVLLQAQQLSMHVVQLSVRKGLIDVPELVGVHVEVVVGDDA